MQKTTGHMLSMRRMKCWTILYPILIFELGFSLFLCLLSHTILVSLYERVYDVCEG